MLKIWGRADGSNVIKAMWCVGELGIAHERIDWGGEFGGNDDPEYRRKNPNGRLPTLEEDDGWTLWESGAVVRYLCMKHSLGNLCPDTPRGRADAEKWMDWSSLNFAGFNGVYLQHYFGPADKRNRAAILTAARNQVQWLDILERHLAGRLYLCGDRFTMADISFSYALLLATTLGLQDDFPAKLVPYWEGLQQRDGFKRALRAEQQPSRSA